MIILLGLNTCDGYATIYGKKRKFFLYFWSFRKILVKLKYPIVHLYAILHRCHNRCHTALSSSKRLYCNCSEQVAWFLLLIFTDDYRLYSRFYCTSIILGINVGA